MNKWSVAVFCVVAGLLSHSSPAATIYVWTNSPADGPGTAWTNAFHTIQAAVDAADSGDTVLVTNGVYNTGGRMAEGEGLTSRVVITNQVIVRSVNGPELTVIQGANPTRCVYLGSNTALIGFTLSSGRTLWDGFGGGSDYRGGGAYCQSAATLSNCVLAGNAAKFGGGGVYHGTLHNCILSSNYTDYDVGGGAFDATLYSCTIVSNSAAQLGGGGAGGGTLYNCILSGNTAGRGGGV